MSSDFYDADENGLDRSKVESIYANNINELINFLSSKLCHCKYYVSFAVAAMFKRGYNYGDDVANFFEQDGMIDTIHSEQTKYEKNCIKSFLGKYDLDYSEEIYKFIRKKLSESQYDYDYRCGTYTDINNYLNSDLLKLISSR